MDTEKLNQLAISNGYTLRLRRDGYWYAHRKVNGQQQAVYLGSDASMSTWDEAAVQKKLRRHPAPQRQPVPLTTTPLPDGTLAIIKGKNRVLLDDDDQVALRDILNERSAS
jgi:hypothetical protein